MRKFYIYGDSHSIPYERIVSEFKDENGKVFNARCVGAGRVISRLVCKDLYDNLIISPALTQQMEFDGIYPYHKIKNKEQPYIVFLLGTGEGGRQSLVESWLECDFIYNGELLKDSGVSVDNKICPLGLVRSSFRNKLRQVFTIIKQFKLEGYERLAFLSAPPPYSNNDEINSLYRAKRPSAELMNLVSPKKRLALYKIAEEVIDDFCKAENIVNIQVPEELCDESGFLSAQFSKDGIHASDDFSRSMIPIIQAGIQEA